MESSGRRRMVVKAALYATVIAKLLVLNAVLTLNTFPERRASGTATVALVLLCLLPVQWLRERRRVPAVLIIDAAVSTLLLADLIHIRFFGDPLSTAEIGHSWQLHAVSPVLFTGLKPADALLYADVLMGGVAWWFWLRRTPAEMPGPRRALVTRLGLLAAGALAVAPIHLVWTDPEEIFFYGTRRRQVVAALGLLPYHVYDASMHALRRLGQLNVSADDRARVRRFFDARRESEPPRTGFFGRARGHNVIIVMAESLTSAPLRITLNGQPVAPALARFADESLHFSNVFEQTHVGTTSDGEFLSMQGLLPLPNGVVATRYPANSFAGLPAILNGQGYETVSANVMSGDFWNMRGMHWNLGFSRSFFEGDFQPGEMIGMGLSDGVFFDQMELRLRSLREPFMAYLITLSNHLPYELPASQTRLNVGALEGTVVGRYLQSVHYFDAVFGRFIESLRASGLLDRSLVVVYGDHRAFWEPTPQLPPLAGVSPDDAFGLWALERRVPLLIRLPHGESASTITEPGGQLDIPPTVLALLGVPSAGEVMLGRDLLGSHEPLVVFRDGSVIAGHQASIVLGDLKQPACFDVQSAARIDCAAMSSADRLAREQMTMSDLAIRGDLVTSLRRPTARDAVTATAAPQPATPGRALVIGHRGNPAEAPENTLASIASAFAAGADIAEVDVRLSRDGVPVIFHDETLERTTNGRGAVADRTLAELKALDAGSWKGAAFSGERIPTLVEALQAARGKGRLLLDVPVPALGATLAKALQAAGLPQSEALIATWDPEQRQDILMHMPKATIIRSEGAPRAWDAGYFAGQRAGGVHVFDIGNWSPAFVRDAHAAGFPVWAYTINDTATMRDLVRNGIDAFETDVPRVAAGIVRDAASLPAAVALLDR